MIWKTSEKSFDLASRALIMGVLNVTIDSFSDGGKYLAPEEAVEHGLEMEAEGADLIDVGGESTRPGALPVPAVEEARRILPVIAALARQSRCALSIDTSKASVARAAVEQGATIINDVTGLRGDPAMIEVARATGAGVIVMHMRETPRTMQDDPQYHDVVAEVRQFFELTFDRVLRYGLDRMSIVFDPGFGFGKTVAHNLELLRNLSALRCGARPLMLGLSRKSFLGQLAGIAEPADRLWPTVALTSWGREQGADIFRVHDVRANREALRMTEAILDHATEGGA